MDNPKVMANIHENALNSSRSIKSYLNATNDTFRHREKTISKFTVEWHRKFTLSIACLVLFLIGAPLGSNNSKRRTGNARCCKRCILFYCFHIMSITGEKFAEEGVLLPREGMWIASAVLFPVGLFFYCIKQHRILYCST